MDNQRLFIWAALAFVLYLNYAAWQSDYAPPPQPAATQTQSASGERADALPSLPAQSDGTPALPSTSAPTTSIAAVEKAPTVRVVTDVLDMEISTRGGELLRADLLKYPKVKGQSEPVRMFNTDNLFVARSGLRAADREQEPTASRLSHG